MRVFITGGTGFIGRRLVPLLADRGHTLRCLVRRSSRVDLLREVGATLVTANLEDKEALERGMEGCDALVHLANVYSFWERDKTVYRRVNVDGTRTVMSSALSAGVPKVVHISTHEVFGDPEEVLSETTPLARTQLSEYGRTKAAGERLLWKMHAQLGLPLIVVYPTAVLGAGDAKPQGNYLRLLARHRFPARFAEQHVMTWVYVGDVAEALARIVEKPGNVGERYLLGQEAVTYGELNRMISEAAGVHLPLVSLPDFACIGVAWLLTMAADLTRRPPAWGISTDEVRTALRDVRCDGSKATRELALLYTPIRQAVDEEVAAHLADSKRRDPRSRVSNANSWPAAARH